MAEVKWIKIVTDIFDDEKVLLIESLPDSDGLIVIWFKLLCLAGKQNNSGVFLMNNRIPYTEEMLAAIFRRPLSTVKLALKTFEDFGMIEVVDGVIVIPNWDKHQSLDQLELAREQTRKRVAKHRERQKQIALGEGKEEDVTQCNVTCNGDVTQSNADRIRIDKNKNKNKNEIENKNKIEKEDIPYEQIKDLYHSICVSLPKVIKLNDNRKRTIKSRWNEYKDIEVFKDLFTKTEESDFLIGKNSNGWQANFDWILNGNNMVKVLEGTYSNKPKITINNNNNSNKASMDDLYAMLEGE